MTRPSIAFVLHGLRVRLTGWLHRVANQVVDPRDSQLGVAWSRAIMEDERLAMVPVAVLILPPEETEPEPVAPPIAIADKAARLACAFCEGIACAIGHAPLSRIAQEFMFCGTGPYVISSRGSAYCRFHALQQGVEATS